jgi:hypothetical protein
MLGYFAVYAVLLGIKEIVLVLRQCEIRDYYPIETKAWRAARKIIVNRLFLCLLYPLTALMFTAYRWYLPTVPSIVSLMETLIIPVLFLLTILGIHLSTWQCQTFCHAVHDHRYDMFKKVKDFFISLKG